MFALSIPTPLVAFACGSPSMRRVRCSAAARLAARFTAVVVLPTPPFWLATAMILATRLRDCGERAIYEWRVPECRLWAASGLEGVSRETQVRLFHVKRPPYRYRLCRNRQRV